MEINLLSDLPQTKRDIAYRANNKNPEQIRLAKKFGWEFFDMVGICYNGYIYDGRWQPVVSRIIDYYKLGDGNSVLDIGCAKGYMLYDFVKANPSFRVAGLDISKYAINCCPPEVNAFVGNAKDLSMFDYKEFNLVISINTIHNLSEVDCRKAVREIQRIGCSAFIVVDAYRNEEERKRLIDWVLTAETVLSVDEWKKLFEDEGYTGDYYWWTP